MTITVEIRMYNMGFGDAFRVTVKNNGVVWRMLIDCGSHSHNTGPGTETAVNTIIDDLVNAAADDPVNDDADNEIPRLDVVVATHRHRDHISGFAIDDWSRVHVKEVWMPYVEDVEDPRTQALNGHYENAASQLKALIKHVAATRTLTANREALRRASMFAINSSVNRTALDRLRNETGFAGRHRIRYLPSDNTGIETLRVPAVGVTAHILGPTDSKQYIKAMSPPASAKWLELNLTGPSQERWRIGDLFADHYVLRDDLVAVEQRAAVRSLGLDVVDEAGLLAAASTLERSINNTSLFFVLEIDGRFRMLFPGDAQHGAWEDIYHRADAKALVESVDFYKIGHHGSHNATPKWFAENWAANGDAMLPWGLVRRWQRTIPHNTLMSTLAERHAVIGLQQDVTAGGVTVTSPPPKGTLRRSGDAWTQLTFELDT